MSEEKNLVTQSKGPEILGSEAQQIVAQIQNVKAIPNEAMHTVALSLYRTGREVLRAIDEFCEPTIEAANKAHKAALEQRRKLKGNLETESLRLKRVIDQYATACAAAERAALAEQQRAITAAAEAAALERAAALEEAAGKMASLAPDAPELAERMRERANAEIANVVAPSLVGGAYGSAQTANALAGTTQRTVWKWAVEDIEKIPREYFALDAGRVNVEVRLLKDKFAVPGIRVYAEKSTGIRG